MSLPTLTPPFATSIILTIIVAAAYLLVSRIGTSRLRCAIIKTVPVAFLAALSVPWGAFWLLTVGLALSALGDLLLAFADEQENNRAEQAFLAGLGAFLLAHLAYFAAFLRAADLSHLLAPPHIFAAAIIAFVAITMAVILWRNAGALRVPVVAYIAAIAAMALAGWATGVPLIAAGVTAFMASDLILGIERFLMQQHDPRRTLSGPAIWMLYIAAQILILTGAVTAA